jgi:hypothetical protein
MPHVVVKLYSGRCRSVGAPLGSMTLESHRLLVGGAIWLRYKPHNRYKDLSRP